MISNTTVRTKNTIETTNEPIAILYNVVLLTPDAKTVLTKTVSQLRPRESISETKYNARRGLFINVKEKEEKEMKIMIESTPSETNDIHFKSFVFSNMDYR